MPLILTPLTPLSLSGPTINTDVIVQSTLASTVPLKVRGVASQSGNLQEWQDSNQAVLARVDSNGELTLQRVTGPALEASGNLSGAGTGGAQNRIVLGLANLAGINSTRGGSADSITDDTANGAGATFFNGLYINSSFASEGSHAGIWSQIAVTEDTVTDKYAEAMGFYAPITTSRKGALTAGIETQNTITTGFPARASGGTFILVENNTLASYTTALGGSSAWATTGARAIWALNSGSQTAGTGLYVQGAFDRAIRGSLTASSQIPLAFRVGGDANERIRVNMDGLAIGDGTSVPDITLQRAAANQLKLLAGSATASAFLITPPNATDFALGARATGDSAARFVMLANGQQEHGDGTNPRDTTWARVAAAVMGLNTAGSALEMKENGTADIAAGGTDTGRLYVRDNGAGKTQLCVRFNTGAVQVIATQP